MPKRLVAETSTGQNVLVPSCYPTLLIIIALSYRNSVAEVLSRMYLDSLVVERPLRVRGGVGGGAGSNPGRVIPKT